MTNVRRFLAVMVFLGMVAYISTSLQGQSSVKKQGSAASPQYTPAKQVSQLAEASESRFSAPGVVTYQPVNGDLYFALQVKPKLEATPRRPRDIVVMMSTAATQAGQSWIAGHQIAEAIIEGAQEFDRISLWTVNAGKATKNLTKDFLLSKDYGEGKRLRDALVKYRTTENPTGDTDLKDALAKVIETFDSSKDRQRVILFLGDGLSTHNPMDEKDRLAIARQMVARKIAFFPVPLGVQVNPNTLHGLANSTGGLVLRTRLDEEKLVDAMKRYEEAFATPILYQAKLELPAVATNVCPSILPPLRSDSPTLVVGRMAKAPKSIDVTITGAIAGRKGDVAIKTNESVLAPSLDNFFLVSLIDQWAKAKEFPAVLRADRSLANCYEQTRLQHIEYLDCAQMALEDQKLGAARELFVEARRLSPHDPQADAGIQIVDKLKDGSLTLDAIKKERARRTGKADRLETVNGKHRWDNVNILLAQNKDQEQPAAKQPGNANPGVIGPENLLKEQRNRQAIEEQKVGNAVDDAIRQARRNLANDPDGTLDMLKNLLSRVKDHPDLGGQVRDALGTRLQAALRESATDAQRLKLKKQNENVAAAVAQKNITREQQIKSFEDRVDAQFRIYKNLMNAGRFEERTKVEIIQAMVQIHDEARQKGVPIPTASKAMYDVALAAYPLQRHNSLIRQREEKWLSILMNIEKAHIPYPDEPPIHFPPIATWKAILKARKDKYEVSSLPDDEKGRLEATAIYRLMQQVIDTKGLQEPVKLKVALEYFSDRFGGKLPILVDKEAFASDPDLGADAPSPYEEEVVLPPVPSKMMMNTALRLVLSQVGKGNATYVIRRSFIEITTNRRYLQDKVIRIYPVGDLVMPINGGFQGRQMAGGIGGGMMGMGGGMMGMMGMGGGMMGMGGGMMGMGGGMMGMGGMGMGGMGGMMGMGGMGMGGMGGMMGMGGMGMGGMGGMMGMGGMGMGGMGGMGMMGMRGMGGGTFQGSFNGGLGAVGATQAAGLISIITRIVDPGNWNQPTINTNAIGIMGMGGFMGFGGMGFMGMGFGGMGFMGMGGFPMMGMMAGAGPPPDPNVNVDPQTSNSIDFFPPALAIIVRAPARVHTSITGGIVGGKGKRLEAAAFLEVERREAERLAKADNKIDPKAKVFGDKVKDALVKREVLDPMKIWQEAFDKGGVDAAHVIATADFLFEAGQPKHAAEFLKANLRHGVVVRPWVFEALAVALEASGGDKEEIRRARLSGIALDPTDAQGFMSAARAMADRGEFDRALAFCKQAALIEPTDYHPYEVALAYAENAKDAKGMEWAVGNLVSQDWPVDNLMIQRNAQKRLGSLVSTLKSEKRGQEADSLETALARLNQRDLIVQLAWDNVGGVCELEMKIKEPSGSVCNLEQKQSPGGGVMLGYNLLDKNPSCQYVAAQAFSGEYEVSVSRLYGQPLGNRARLIVTANAGTRQEVRKVEIVQLDKTLTFKVKLKEGRRTELASVSPAAQRSHEARAERETNAFHDLRAIANPNFYGAVGPRGSVGTPGLTQSVASMAARDSKNQNASSTTVMQNSIRPSAGGVQMTAQVRMNPDQRNYDMVIRPFFDAAALRAGRPAVNLSAIPGGGN